MKLLLEIFSDMYWKAEQRAYVFLRDLPHLVVDLGKAAASNFERRRRRQPSGNSHRASDGGNSVWSVIASNERSEYVPGQQTRHASRGWRYRPEVWFLLERLDERRKWEAKLSATIEELMGDIRWMLENPPRAVTPHTCSGCTCNLDAYRAAWEEEWNRQKLAITA